MRILSEKALRTFWERHPNSEQSLRAWVDEVKRADWDNPAQVRDKFATASIVKDNRVVFNIGGNQFRLVAWINYRRRSVYIKWLGTHAEYDRIDVEKVGL